ncbi:MAG: hypothetical protein AB2807_02390 [Candidatus Sedimenticola endophacoides]
MTDKSGGDNVQIQSSGSNTTGYQDQNTVTAGGTTAVGSMGANSRASGLAHQQVSSALLQAAGGLAGYAGHDNVSTNSGLNIS